MSDVTRIAGLTLLGACVLGGIGWAAGYYGPAAVNPDASLAPLTGLFVTGPLWAAAGFFWGIIAAVRRVGARRIGIELVFLALLAAGSTFLLLLPEDRFEAEFVEGEIVRCQTPAVLAPAAVARWQGLSDLRSGWRDDVPRMLRSSRGAVVTLHIDRSKKLYRSAKPWSAGKLVTSGWKYDGRTKDFFASYAGDSCAAYRPGMRGTYALDWLASRVSPPDILPPFLGLEVLRPLRDQH